MAAPETEAEGCVCVVSWILGTSPRMTPSVKGGSGAWAERQRRHVGGSLTENDTPASIVVTIPPTNVIPAQAGIQTSR